MAKKVGMAKAMPGAMTHEAGARGQEPGSDGDGNLLALLTGREREVLRLYLESFNAKEVARRLGTRPQTVRNQLASIEQKVGVEGREELVASAMKIAF